MNDDETAYLIQTWEWQAAMELMSIAQGLLSNGFYNPDELVQRLEELANAIATTHGRGEMAALKAEILGLRMEEHPMQELPDGEDLNE